MQDRGTRIARGWAGVAMLLVCGVPFAEAQVTSAPAGGSGGTIRISGAGLGPGGQSPLVGMLLRLEADYATDHPGARFVHALNGNSSALGAVYVGAADVALMDREPSFIELDGYQQAITGQKPFREAVMRGGVSVAGHSSPLVVLVNRANPVDAVSLAQLAGVFGAKGGEGDAGVVWGNLGGRGAWATRRVALYGFGVDTDAATLFRTAAMDGSRSWRCEFQQATGGTEAEAARRIAERVAADPNAIAFTTLDAVVPGTKALGIRMADGGLVRATPEMIASGRYPFGRTVLALARAGRDGAPEDSVRSFLVYLVSARAAAVMAAQGEYLPLPETLLREEREAVR